MKSSYKFLNDHVHVKDISKRKEKKNFLNVHFCLTYWKICIKKIKMNVDDPPKTMKGKESDPSIWPKGFI